MKNEKLKTFLKVALGATLSLAFFGGAALGVAYAYVPDKIESFFNIDSNKTTVNDDKDDEQPGEEPGGNPGEDPGEEPGENPDEQPGEDDEYYVPTADELVVEDGVLKSYTGTETKIKLPESVTEIYDAAFFNCTSLTSIIIPKSVTRVGVNAFFGCTGLKSVVIEGDFVASENIFLGCTNLKTIYLPDNFKEISTGMFCGCTSLTSIIIPESVTKICTSAFADTNLTSVTIPASVTCVDDYAFGNCTRLISITIKAIMPPTLVNTSAIPANVTEINVPAASVEAYKTATNWSNFANIIVAI